MFDKLYNSVIESTKEKTTQLVKNNIINWHSDDFSYETASCLLITKQNETFNLLKKLLQSEDKQELQEVYEKLNTQSMDMNFDEMLIDIRRQLADISKEDVVSKMKEMQEKIHSKNYIQFSFSCIVFCPFSLFPVQIPLLRFL